MPDATAPPFWAAPALLAAVVAALGFVGKTIADLVLRLRADARDRRSRLTELYALLRAGDVAFAVQRELRMRLASQLRERLPKTANLPPGFDRLFFATYAEMTDEERQLHLLIRTMTVHTFRPLNQSLLEWLRADRYFRAVGRPCALSGAVGGTLGALGREIRSMDPSTPRACAGIPRR